ncbi:MAG: RNA-binding cell elongation regulator Jag/EloR [Smithella sp.]|jgi:spoIIIJ-associated protein
MSSKTLEIEEKSIDEAIEKACSEFGVSREKLNIEIISGESGGFLGLFSKKAKIRASLLSLDMDFSFTDKPKPKSELKIKMDSKKNPEKEVPAEKSKKRMEPVAESAEKPKKRMEPVAESAEKSLVPVPVEVTIADPIPVSIMGTKAKDLLEGILLRISPEYKVIVNETQEKIILSIEGDDSGLLIGKRGQNLDALQYILNKAINKIDNDHKMILIDLGEYRKRREEFLLGLAEKIREKVKKTKKPVSLAHMNAHDRRIIHMVLQEDESLITQSRGEGKYRKVVILPARTGNSKRSRAKKQE